MDRVWPKIAIGIELAKKMKWIESDLGYVLGPNLRKEFPDEVPTALDVTGGPFLQNGS